ncbi:uncharacterized protein LOC111705902, partial [Eurytemora carolleeae]|uniref:uncharacterized protein LOC111705902 n=1 Tax=Eurytemora carolleeae TaxID=1294199 RepID=UPI000C773184
MICKFGFYSSDIGVNINPLHDLTPTEENQGFTYTYPGDHRQTYSPSPLQENNLTHAAGLTQNDGLTQTDGLTHAAGLTQAARLAPSAAGGLTPAAGLTLTLTPPAGSRSSLNTPTNLTPCINFDISPSQFDVWSQRSSFLGSNLSFNSSYSTQLTPEPQHFELEATSRRQRFRSNRMNQLTVASTHSDSYMDPNYANKRRWEYRNGYTNSLVTENDYR